MDHFHKSAIVLHHIQVMHRLTGHTRAVLKTAGGGLCDLPPRMGGEPNSMRFFNGETKKRNFMFKSGRGAMRSESHFQH